MNEDLKLFYAMVKETRAGVLNWLEALPHEVFVQERPDFAYGSLRGIYAHIAHCYRVWLSTRGLGLPVARLHPETAAELREVFEGVDAIVAEALEAFTHPDEPIHIDWDDGEVFTPTRRWLVLHPITHEFHHKGQALALARVIGHPHPGNPDTDLKSLT
ncbi:DinB family protein [Deinococcus roseus]|uniref:DNA damage-inducible protein DinB n=1 Tax=Deinococcus roseus TaxID=392414 RepID=A0ABQ2DGE7_9DEIO|nr:DinB family protein [Deinococcus roseus]GGJ56826.1 DNA damage-inducible protein DinB [Deinococcus roseus]